MQKQTPTVICYSGCDTCRKALKWLKSNQISYTSRSIKEERPTVDELRSWTKCNSIPLNKLFNTSGQLYRELKITEIIKTATEEELLEILASDGMIVKRPILVHNDRVIVGFKEDEWTHFFCRI